MADTKTDPTTAVDPFLAALLRESEAPPSPQDRMVDAGSNLAAAVDRLLSWLREPRECFVPAADDVAIGRDWIRCVETFASRWWRFSNEGCDNELDRSAVSDRNPEDWDSACERIAAEARTAADANWRELALSLAAADDELAALVVGLLADGIEEPFRARLVSAMKRATEAAEAVRRADA